MPSPRPGTSPSSGTYCPLATGYAVYRDSDHSGDDIRDISDVSVLDMVRLCNALADCKSFAWTDAGVPWFNKPQHGWIKRASSLDSNSGTLKGLCFYVKLSAPPPPINTAAIRVSMLTGTGNNLCVDINHDRYGLSLLALTYISMIGQSLKCVCTPLLPKATSTANPFSSGSAMVRSSMWVIERQLFIYTDAHAAYHVPLCMYHVMLKTFIHMVYDIYPYAIMYLHPIQNDNR